MKVLRRVAALVFVLLLLFGSPWWTLVYQPGWPVGAFAAGTAVFAVALLGFPLAMYFGHARVHSDVAARCGDTTLGVVWVLFTWCVFGDIALLVLKLSGVDGVTARHTVALVVLAVAVILLAWAMYEARRVPRVRRAEIPVQNLDARLDGLRIAVIADTHFGPLNRTRWSSRLVELTNSLHPDVVCHVGDLADGTVVQRRNQVAPLRDVVAPLGRFYITGNHEYFNEAQAWLDHMAALGWTPLHNRHCVLTRDGAAIVFAGVDDPTGTHSGLPGHGPNHRAALAGSPAGAPVVLLAHQPKMIKDAVAADVDLQLSGHTHGGQIWPFHYIVRLDQRHLQGLHRITPRTHLYTSRGAGFWGPPFRLFAPAELPLLTLRQG